MKPLTLRPLLVLALAASVLGLASLALPRTAWAASSKPALHLARVSGHTLGIAGRRWGARAHVTFTVQSGAAHQEIQVQTTRTGVFLVGIDNVDRCGAYVFQARDSRGRVATLRTAQKGCPASAGLPAPVLVVLKGKLMTAQSGTTATSTTVTTVNGWKTYRNQEAGYAVDYPASWSVDTQAGANGMLSTAFLPPGGGVGIVVTAQPGSPGDLEPGDIPNTRCSAVRIGGLSGTRCMDTIGFTLATTLYGNGKIYIISTSMRRSPPGTLDVYEQLLNTFRLIS